MSGKQAMRATEEDRNPMAEETTPLKGVTDRRIFESTSDFNTVLIEEEDPEMSAKEMRAQMAHNNKAVTEMQGQMSQILALIKGRQASTSTGDRDPAVARREAGLAAPQNQEPRSRASLDFLEQHLSPLYRAAEDVRPPRRTVIRQPLCEDIMKEQINGTPPTLPTYNGTTDPEDHVSAFCLRMQLQNWSNAAMCRTFPSTFSGLCLDWYNRLPGGIIETFEEFIRLFTTKFASQKRCPLHSKALVDLKQKEGESLRAFYSRWSRVAMAVRDLTPETAAQHLMDVTTNAELRRALAKMPVVSTSELESKVEKAITLEETLGAGSVRRFEPSRAPGEDQARRNLPPVPYHGGGTRQPGPVQQDRLPRRRSPDRRRMNTFTPLNDTVKNVFHVIREKGYRVNWPAPQKVPENMRNHKKYCDFHRETGHMTEDCYQLKVEIEALIRRGHLAHCVAGAENDERKEKKPPPPPNARYDDEGHYVVRKEIGVVTIERSPRKRTKRERATECASASHPNRQLEFTDAEFPRGKPSEEPLAITALIASCKTHRLLVDGGSAADILFRNTLDKMDVDPKMIKHSRGSLVGFSGESVPVVGTVALRVIVGDHEPREHKVVEFTIVDCPSPHNGILGRPFLATFRAIASTCHQKVKFPTASGVGCAWGMEWNKTNEVAENSANIVDARMEEEPRAESVDSDFEVAIDPAFPERKVRISTHVPNETLESLVKLLQEFKELFAWSTKDMPRVPREIAEHCLAVPKEAKPRQQVRRTFTGDKLKAIEEELWKLLAAGLIREVRYPKWLANVVLVKKASGAWRMCVDYTTINKVCPGDPYPLPRIDQLIDATSNHETLSFLDMFSGYHQIPMSREDEEKTAFMTPFGNFCFTGMPFGLKNAGATYQRLINTVFAKQIGRNVEAYVDDLIVKTRSGGSHIEDLREAFQAMRDNNLRLNPLKCVFNAEAGKFLGFMITKRGIEADPKQVEAIQQLKSPRNATEIQTLAGKMNALGRFIPRSADKCAPFFQTLKKGTKFKWTPSCEAAFTELKKHLASPPVMTAPIMNEKLFLYLAVSHQAVSAVLVSKKESIERPVYYTSHTLNQAEKKYPAIEKATLALVIASQKLRPYFQAHEIVVLTNLPLKRILSTMDVAGRLVKWAVALSEFDINYAPRPSIKAQVLADFVAEGVVSEATEAGIWEVSVDGAASKHGAGAGVVVRTPLGVVHEVAIRFRTLKTNNASEYEAVLAGLKTAKELGAHTIKIISDSALVINQLNGLFDAKDDTLTQYMHQVNEGASTFKAVTYTHVPREENMHADALSKLATATDFEETRMVCVQKESPTQQVEGRINETQLDDADWCTPIIDYLINGTVPKDPKEAWKLRQRAARSTMVDNELYKRAHSGVYLKCVGQEDARRIIADLHEGMCAMHMGARSLERNILLGGYYWPRVKKDAKEFVDCCHKCQLHARLHHIPSAEFQANISPWPFAQWGLDLLGPFPTAKGKRKYIIVAVYYFTKWVEAEPLAQITAQQVLRFIKNNLLSRFGVPQSLVFDHGKQFDCAEVIDFCDHLNIIARFASVAYPQANGQAEAANKSILHGLHTRLGEAKGSWADELHSVLWAHRTTHKTSTGETPFALTYGTEAVIPIETQIPSFRLTHYNATENSASRTTDLDLAEELRDTAAVRLAAGKAQVARHYNKKLRPHNLSQSELVLKRNFRPNPKHGKLAPNWEGPYRVREVVGANTFKLEEMSGQKIPRTWNAQNLRRYRPAAEQPE